MISCWLSNNYCRSDLVNDGSPQVDELTDTVKESILEYVVRVIHQGRRRCCDRAVTVL